MSNISFGQQNLKDLLNVFSIAMDGGFVEHDIEGHEFRDLPKDPEFVEAINRGFPKGKCLIITPAQPLTISIFGVEVDLGKFQIEMIEPTIIWYDSDKSSMLMKAADDTYIFRFHKFGKLPIANTEVLWHETDN